MNEKINQNLKLSLIMKMHIVYFNNPKINSPIIDITKHFDVSIQDNGRALMHKKGTAHSAIDFDDLHLQELVNYECKNVAFEPHAFLKLIEKMNAFYKHAYKISLNKGEHPPFIEFWNVFNQSRPYSYLSALGIANDFKQWRNQAVRFNSGNFLKEYDQLAEIFNIASRNGGIWIKPSK